MNVHDRNSSELLIVGNEGLNEVKERLLFIST
jgi:hypothetical protein